MAIGNRQRILEAAEAVFAVKGYHLSAVDEIAEKAGVAKGTIFYNFGSKAELFETMLSNGMQYITGAIQKELATAKPPLEQIAAIIDIHVATLMENPGLIAIFSRELTNGLDEHVRQTIRRTRDEYVAFVAGLLEEARRYGIVRPMDGAMLASTFFDMGLSACAYAREHNQEPAAVAGFLKTLILDGVTQR